MTILNYFFIGTAFTFIIDLLLLSKKVQEHPKMKNILDVNWGLGTRIACIFIWPIGVLIFLNAFIKQIFKKW